MKVETREVLRLAWPAVLSYVLNNAYRMNDQFWVQGLGGEAQAALGATFFVAIMNFSVIFLAAGGTLALIARATGARDPEARASTARHALLFAVVIGLVLSVVGTLAAETIVGWLGLRSEVGALGVEYLGALYTVILPLAVVPALDHIFIGWGDTKTPMRLLCLAVGLNYFLNPILIYGADAAVAVPSAPLAGVSASIAEALGIEGLGIRGAAYATGGSRLISVSIGLAILRYRRGVNLVGSLRPKLARLRSIASISVPMSVSIATYAGVYWAVLAIVLSRLDPAVTAGLGLGFTVFEGAAYPCYLGVSIATASLVGRNLGAGDPDGAWGVIRSARSIGRILGLSMALAFWFVAPLLAPLFTEDEGVLRETIVYCSVLAFSQYWVSVETINEKVLLGAGYTRPIMLISMTGNLLRIPLAFALAVSMDHGAAGVWWAINLTTYFKAGMCWWTVQRGRWA